VVRTVSRRRGAAHRHEQIAIIAPLAHPNQALFLLRELEYELMHMNAS
jgi:hypothetical protein